MPRFAVFALLIATTATAGEPLRIISWNVESGGADAAVIAKQLGTLPDCSIYALQEVSEDDIGRYGQAIRDSHGKSFRYFASWTGQSDRLLVAYDDDRLDLLEWRELFKYGDHELNDWRHRSPLVCLFADAATGHRFYFVTVHLARGDAKLRTEQAKGLAAWAAENGTPTIAAGDFNFDYDFRSGRGNAGYDAMRARGVWRWVKPAKMVDTNWADSDGDGVDNYPDSCLDFAFVASMPTDWQVMSQVIVRAGDFPDDRTTSDHRPIAVQVSIGDGTVAQFAPIAPLPMAASLAGEPPATPAGKYWLNTSSGVRHNAGCKNFNNTKRGRWCDADDGKPCGICGG